MNAGPTPIDNSIRVPFATRPFIMTAMKQGSKSLAQVISEQKDKRVVHDTLETSDGGQQGGSYFSQTADDLRDLSVHDGELDVSG